MSLSKSIKRGLLVLLSGLLLLSGTWVAGIDKVVNNLSQFPPWILAGMLMIFALNLVLVSFRLGMLLGYFGVKVPFGVVANASIQGHLASLFFISLFGQAAGRQSVLRHYSTQPVAIAALTAIERVIVFFVSAGLGLSGAAWILAEFGLFGAIILIAIFSWVFVITIHNGLHKSANRAAVMLLGVLIIFSLVHEIFYQRIFWLALGLCLAMPYRGHFSEKL